MEKRKISLLIKKSALVFDKLSNQLLAPYDLTNSQFKILMVLYHASGDCVRQADIEERFSMTNPTVTGLVQKLEVKDLVRRIPHPIDGRSKVLTLTEKSLTMKEELLELANELECRMTANLTAAERDRLAVLLEKMLR